MAGVLAKGEEEKEVLALHQGWRVREGSKTSADRSTEMRGRESSRGAAKTRGRAQVRDTTSSSHDRQLINRLNLPVSDNRFAHSLLFSSLFVFLFIPLFVSLFLPLPLSSSLFLALSPFSRSYSVFSPPSLPFFLLLFPL